jgi:5-methylcytosine-specific restriction endonuclease McrA
MKKALGPYAVQFMRRAYFAAQCGICGICHKPMSKKGSRSGLKVNFDHVWPRSKCTARNAVGAAHGNILLCHFTCNQAKADRPPTDSEVAMLHQTNRRLGLPESETAIWDRPPSRPEIGANENEPEHQQRGDAAAQ